MQIRRIKMDDYEFRFDKKWILFRNDHLETPIAVLEEWEVDSLVESIQQQKERGK